MVEKPLRSWAYARSNRRMRAVTYSMFVWHFWVFVWLCGYMIPCVWLYGTWFQLYDPLCVVMWLFDALCVVIRSLVCGYMRLCGYMIPLCVVMGCLVCGYVVIWFLTASCQQNGETWNVGCQVGCQVGYHVSIMLNPPSRQWSRSSCNGLSVLLRMC